MGGWIFFEPWKNTVHLVRTPTDGDFTSMPDEGKQFEAQVNQYKAAGREMLFIGMFHTHPNGDKQPSSFMGDLEALGSRGLTSPKKEGGPPVGFVIYG